VITDDADVVKKRS